MLTTNHEDRLVNQLRAGDAAAFDALFDIYAKRLYGFAFKYLKSELEAEELVQEVFVRIWENRKSLKSNHSFKAYLFTIALNQIRNFFNKRSLSLKYVSQVTDGNPEADNRMVESIDYASVLKRVDDIVETFPERKKLIFQKSRKEGQTSKEIAAELNITVGAVDNQISDAIRIIREILQREDLAVLLFMALFFS